jgi:hypothetical protein
MAATQSVEQLAISGRRARTLANAGVGEEQHR